MSFPFSLRDDPPEHDPFPVQSADEIEREAARTEPQELTRRSRCECGTMMASTPVGATSRFGGTWDLECPACHETRRVKITKLSEIPPYRGPERILIGPPIFNRVGLPLEDAATLSGMSVEEIREAIDRGSLERHTVGSTVVVARDELLESV